jgi:drug/metabolite transporter (DMT)-like permease
MQNRVSAVGDNVGLAVFAIITANLAISLSDAAMKLISAKFVLWQIFVTRSIIAIPLLIAIILLRFWLDVFDAAPFRLGGIAQPDVDTFLGRVCPSLPHLALGVAAVTLFTLPIFITLFAALFIGDRIGLIGWASILLGFVGVALILKPTPRQLQQIRTFATHHGNPVRVYGDTDANEVSRRKSLVLSLVVNFSFFAIGLLATLLAMFGGSTDEVQATSFLFGEWSTMGTVEWLTMALLAAAAIINSVGAAIAYQVGPSATVATFDLTYVGFAALWGFLFFAEVLDGVTLTGMALIITAGVLAVRR